MFRALTVLLALVIALPASAGVEAKFIDGTYVMSEDACEKLKRLQEGTTPSVSTGPWSAHSKGFDYWEGGCEFSKVTEKAAGREWVVVAECVDGPEETTETYTFVRKGEGVFAVTLKGDKDARTYTRCDVKTGK